MELLPISFLAGILTILAPCVLPVLPIIVGSSLSSGKKDILRPIVITMSLGLSIIVFTLLLKATTVFIDIPDIFWKWFSASIILIFAFSLLFPKAWGKVQDTISFGGSLKNQANKSIAGNTQKEGLLSAFLIGIALGPVFAACSPTFFIILGTVLPASFGIGLLNLFAYAFGLSIMLLTIAFAGQRVMSKLNIAANPDGWFKKGMGILFLIVGIAIVTGIDKKIETKFVEQGYGVTDIETNLIKDYLKKDIVKKETEIEANTKTGSNQLSNPITKSVRVTEVSGKALPLPSSEILAGGPPKDGIPPLDAPKFITEGKADWLNPADEGVGIVDSAGVATFYPFRVLVWHEIVNTQVAHNGQNNFPVSITYCPLCKTAIVFEGMVDGVPTTFGTSGKLWQSNLLMYDRSTGSRQAADASKESLWSQVLGTAVQGPATGIKLTVYPSTITTFAKWKGTYPQSRVLSKETGFNRNYSQSPYGGYDESSEVYFPTNFSDTKTHPKTKVLGLEIDDNYIAFEKSKISTGKSESTFAGKFIDINRTAGDTITFNIGGEQVSYIEGFWFSWQAVHPATVLR